MSKILDLSRPVAKLVGEYPEVAEIMSSLGFAEITNKAMLRTVGRLVTIPKGARMKGIDLQTIIRKFQSEGFEVTGLQGADSADGSPSPRVETLKGYLQRLNDGEDIETVKADFAREFKNAEASEIMQAEQELISGGVPVRKAKHLCDIHSALFHGATDGGADIPQTKVAGHPLFTLRAENDSLAALADKALGELGAGGDAAETMALVAAGLRIHYAKKGDLLYPLLKEEYGISGPAEVMWTVDDEIRQELGALLRTRAKGRGDAQQWRQRAKAVMQRAREMVFKENNILFKVCAEHFTPQQWRQIYRDSLDYGPCPGVEPQPWAEAEEAEPEPATADSGRIQLPGGGSLTPGQLAAMLRTMPFEITFVDTEDVNRFFGGGGGKPKVFKRPAMALGREVFSCHPPKVQPMVRSIISDFRSGRKDSVAVWMEKGGKPYLVTYMAVRGQKGNYLGTLEIVEDMEAARRHFAGSGESK